MRQIEQSSENAMIMAWAEAERSSPRHRCKLICTGIDVSTSLTPALARETLQWRGYPDQYIFNGFPNSMPWSLVAVTVSELGDFLLCKYYTFCELTQGTRLVRDAAANVDHVQANEDLNDRIKAVEAAYAQGHRPEPLIAVRQDESSRPVIAEGNTRAVAYLRARPSADEVKVILGTSSQVASWQFL